eukprot:g19409.t1
MEGLRLLFSPGEGWWHEFQAKKAKKTKRRAERLPRFGALQLKLAGDLSGAPVTLVFRMGGLSMTNVVKFIQGAALLLVLAIIGGPLLVELIPVYSQHIIRNLCDPAKFEEYVNETMQRLWDDPFIDDCHHVPQAYYLTSLDGHRLCDHIVRYEHLQTELTQLLKLYHNLSEKATRLGLVNRHRACKSLPMSEELQQRLRDALMAQMVRWWLVWTSSQRTRVIELYSII